MNLLEFIQLRKDGKIELPRQFSTDEVFQQKLNENYKEMLQEVKLGGGAKLTKAVQLLASVMSKRFGSEFKNLGSESYKREISSGTGFRMMNENGQQLRFNFDSFGKGPDLTSVDYWEASNTNLTLPNKTVFFASDESIVKIVNSIYEALVLGRVNGDLNEAKRSQSEKKQWLSEHGLPASLSKSEKCFIVKADAKGFGEEARLFLTGGQPETNSTEKSLQKAEQKFDEMVYADPDTVFEDIEDLLELIKNKSQKSLIILGQGGIGKTFHVTEGSRSLKTLGPQGSVWEYHSGSKLAPFSFYKTLYQERDKIIVWDEADSLFKNDDIITMMKPILDSSGENYAAYGSMTKNMVGLNDEAIEEYCYETDMQILDGRQIGVNERKHAVLPSKFKFTGSMVFISNMGAKQMEPAVLSRSMFVDVHLAASDVLKRIESIARAQAKSLGESKEETDEIMAALGASMSSEEHVINYMTPELARKSKKITVRALGITRNLKKSGLKNWARLAALYA